MSFTLYVNVQSWVLVRMLMCYLIMEVTFWIHT